jgi:hypothetical protein
MLAPGLSCLLQQLPVSLLPRQQQAAPRLSLQLSHADLKVGMQHFTQSVTFAGTADRLLLLDRGTADSKTIVIILLLLLRSVDGDNDLAHLLADVAPGCQGRQGSAYVFKLF